MASSKKQRIYAAVDLNNAEEKEMPIQFGSAQSKQMISQSIGILF